MEKGFVICSLKWYHQSGHPAERTVRLAARRALPKMKLAGTGASKTLKARPRGWTFSKRK